MMQKITLFIILLCAILLRTVNLNSVPNGLFSDEASFLINSVALQNTLHDEDNRFLPLYLQSIKDPKPALYSYLQIPFIKIFGVSTATSRLPSAIMGVISIYISYLLIIKMRGERNLATIIALVLTFSPWHVMISRSTQEIIMSFMFSVWSLLLFQDLDNNLLLPKKVEWSKKTIVNLLSFTLINLLAMYTYHSSKIFILVYVLCMVALRTFQDKHLKKRRASLFIVAAVIAPLIITLSGATVRFKAIGILNSDLPQAQINDFIANTTKQTPGLLLRIFYNKGIFYSRYFLTQYLDHFTGNFWFVSGGKTGSQTIPAHGMLYFPDALLMGIGLLGLLRLKKYSNTQLQWFLMLLASPIAAALTTEDIPSSTRSFFMVLPLSFFIGLGLYELIHWKSNGAKRSVSLALGFFYLWSVGYFVQQYFVQGPRWHSWYRSRDYEITAQEISKEYPKFGNIIITDDLREMYIYLWLNGIIHIKDIQQQPLARYEDEYTLGNISFNRNICDFSKATNDTLIVGMPDCKVKNFTKLHLYRLTYFDDQNVKAFGLYQLATASQSATYR